MLDGAGPRSAAAAAAATTHLVFPASKGEGDLQESRFGVAGKAVERRGFAVEVKTKEPGS